jgi:uncharacterized membrane protein
MIFFPKIAEAAVVSNISSLTLLDKIVSTLVNPLIKVFIGIALIVFLWGVAQFLKNAANEKDKGEGKEHMLWGIIGLTIMLSALGILNLINSFWA